MTLLIFYFSLLLWNVGLVSMDTLNSDGYEYEGYTNIAIQLYVIYIQYNYYRLAVVQYFILYNNELI